MAANSGLEDLSEHDFQIADKVLKAYLLAVNDGSFQTLIKTNTNLQAINTQLSEINKNKRKRATKESIVNKRNTHLQSVETKLPNQSKWLKSMAGSGVLTKHDLPSEGHCMDSFEPQQYIQLSSNSEIIKIEKDVFEHLHNLKTSTTISEYNVKTYSDKQLRHCVICGGEYSIPHKFYHQFCLPCAEFNYMKRTQKIYIPTRIAFVTGLRAKIGYEVALKLLQSGSRVLGTTRFPKDALRRYSLEPDFECWKERLSIYPIDFRNLTAVGKLIGY
jgi:hypothetical protein